MKLSNCCGAQAYSNGDADLLDFEICSDCKEHCEYIWICDECGEEDCTCNENKESAKIYNIDKQHSNG